MSKNQVQRKAKRPEEIKAVLYGRISVNRPNEQSIANQQREMREWCASMGWEIVGDFHDRGRSAYKLDVDREGFESAMGLIESGAANHLVVWKLDRMSRNVRGFAKINERLEAANATFASKCEPWCDTSSPIGYALVMLMAALAQIEAEGIQGRALSWHEGRDLRMMPPVGNRPFGYLRVDAKGNPTPNQLTVNPFESAIMLEMAMRVLAGESLRSIARDLTARNIPTALGATKWAPNTVRGILISPTTAAMVEIDENYQRSDKWEPILDESLWRAVREILVDDSRVISKSTRRHILTNLMRCAKCDGRLITRSHTAGRRYGCEACGNGIDATVADETISRWILENTSNDQWQSMLTQGRGTDQRVIEELQARIDDLWMERATNPNRVSKSVYESTMATLEGQLAAAMTEPAIDIPNVANLHNEWISMSNDDKRRVIKARCQSITVVPHSKGITRDKRIKVIAA